MRKLLTLLALIVLAPVAHAQLLVNCATGVTCSQTGPSMTGTGDPAWLAFGKINTDLNQIYQGPITMATVGGVVLGSATGGALGAGTVNAQGVYVQGVSVVSDNLVAQYGANNTGSNDVSSALNTAAAVHGTIIVPPGQYLLNGTATVSLSNVDIDCQGTTANANTSYGATGATFVLTSTTVQPFTIGSGVRIRNCNFYWPNQTGSASTPTSYPPLFTEQSGQQISNFDLLNDRIINAYDFLDQTSCSDPFGNIHLTDTYGYAIRYWFSLCNVPETWTVTGMSADWNLFQNVANAGPNYYLVKWTAQNGAFLHVFGNGNGTTTASTDSVGGLIFSGSIFAYNKFIWVDSTGSISESKISGIVDAVPHILEVDSGGCAAQVGFDAQYYPYTWNPPSGGAGGTDNAPAFSIATPASGFSGCADTNIDIGGTFNNAQGDVLDLSGAYIKAISLHLKGNGAYAQTSTAGTYYFANINGANVILDAFGNHVEPKTAGSSSKGFNIQSCYQCTLNGNSFNGVYDPIAVSSASSLSAQGNSSLATPSGGVLTGTGTFAHQLLLGNAWDSNALPTPGVSSCGTSPSVNSGSSDASGSIAVGTGTVTACTLTFANAYSVTPKCFASAGAGGATWMGATSASAVTFNTTSSNGGSTLWYHCDP